MKKRYARRNVISKRLSYFFILSLVILSCNKDENSIPEPQDPVRLAETAFHDASRYTTVDSTHFSERQRMPKTLHWDLACSRFYGDTTMVYVPAILKNNMEVKSGGLKGSSISNRTWLMIQQINNTYEYNLVVSAL